MIQFKDIKAGHTLYLLDKSTVEYSAVKVDSVRPPYFAPNSVSATKVVDITLNYKGTLKTYVLAENATMSYADSLMLATDKQQVTLEVQSMRGTAEVAVKSYDANVAIVEKCDKVLEQLDQTIAEKRETERRFASLEQKLNELISKLT